VTAATYRSRRILRLGPVARPPVDLPQPPVGQVAAADPGVDHGPQAPVQPGALVCGRGGVHRLLHVRDLDVLAGDGRDDRGDEPLAQPPLGVGVLAGPPLVRPVPVRRLVVGDQGGTRLFHAGGLGREPLGDLGQLGGQPGLVRSLPVPALPVLQEDRSPRIAVLRRGVHRDPVVHLDDRAAIAARGLAVHGA
jgi:hypothetical protein